jgi:hypothetical protein
MISATPYLPKVPRGQVPLAQRYFESLRLPTALLFGFICSPFRYRSALVSSLLCRNECYPTSARGLFFRPPHPGYLNGNGRISQVPEGPLCLHAMLSDPGRISVPCRSTPKCCLPPLEQRRLPHFTLSRLDHTACRLPVYASQDELPHHHATLGSGCRHTWPGWIVYPPGPYERFPARILPFLLSQALPGALQNSFLKNPFFGQQKDQTLSSSGPKLRICPV